MDAIPDLDELLDQLDARVQQNGTQLVITSTSCRPTRCVIWRQIVQAPRHQNVKTAGHRTQSKLDSGDCVDVQLDRMDANHNDAAPVLVCPAATTACEVQVEPLLLDLDFGETANSEPGNVGDKNVERSGGVFDPAVSLNLMDIELDCGAAPADTEASVDGTNDGHCSSTTVVVDPSEDPETEVRVLLSDLLERVVRTCSPSQPLHISLTGDGADFWHAEAAVDAGDMLTDCVDDATIDQRIDDALAELEMPDLADYTTGSVSVVPEPDTAEPAELRSTQNDTPVTAEFAPADNTEQTDNATAEAVVEDVQPQDELDADQQQVVESAQPAVDAVEESSLAADVPQGRLVTDERSLDQFWDNSWHLTESEMQLGKVKPYWIPDADSPDCMLCSKKFTVMRRRHHCRSCGRVLCAACCKTKVFLQYVGALERVCEPCARTLERVAAAETERQLAEQQLQQPQVGHNERAVDVEQSDAAGQPSSSDSPPPPYEATAAQSSAAAVAVDEQQPESAQSGGATADVAAVEAGTSAAGQAAEVGRNGSRRVMFSDGHRPGSAPDGDVQTDRRRPVRKRRSGGTHSSGSMQWLMLARELNTFLPTALYENTAHPLHANLPVRLNEGTYPVAIVDGDEMTSLSPEVLRQFWGERQDKLRVVVKRNLHVLVSKLTLDCCTGDSAWLLQTDGMRCAGADELVLLVQRPELQRDGELEQHDGEQQLQEELGQAADPYYLPPALFPNLEYFRIFDRMYELSIKGARFGEYDTVPIEQLHCWAVSGTSGRADTPTSGSVQLLGGGGVHAMGSFDEVYCACLFHRPSLQVYSDDITPYIFPEETLHHDVITFVAIIISRHHVVIITSSISSRLAICQPKCLSKIADVSKSAPPSTMFIMLLRREELRWARALPLRLLMRAGMTSAVYPWPIVNPTHRAAYFESTDSSMLALFIDFTSGSYSVPHLRGGTAVVDVQGHIVISIPADQHSKVVAALDVQSDSALLAFGTQCDVSDADSHLVCEQSNDGGRNFRTHVFAIEGKTRQKTSATFFVLNSGTGLQANAVHLSLVEDGVVVRLGARAYETLLSAIREKRQLTLASGQLELCWLDAEATSTAAAVYYGAEKSPVDGRSLRGCRRVRISGELLSASNVPSTNVQLRLVELLLLCETWSGRVERAESLMLTTWSQVGKVLEPLVAATLAPFAQLLRRGGQRTVVCRVRTGADAMEYGVAEWQCVQSEEGDGALAAEMAEAHAAWCMTLDDVMIPALVQHAATLPSATFELTFALLEMEAQ